jgi:hypothetical protein
VPPRDEGSRHVFRCWFDRDEAWERRILAVERLVEHMMKWAEEDAFLKGRPPPFAEPAAPDHLDLSRPLDFAALFAPAPAHGGERAGRRRRAAGA